MSLSDDVSNDSGAVFCAIIFSGIVVRARGRAEAWPQAMVRMTDGQPRAIAVVVGNMSLVYIAVFIAVQYAKRGQHAAS